MNVAEKKLESDSNAGEVQGEMCLHRKLRSKCKICREPEICVHGHEKFHCKECRGPGMCEHGKRKTRCRECGGSEFCVHGREKFRCRDCGGAGMCVHGRRRDRCKECLVLKAALSTESTSATASSIDASSAAQPSFAAIIDDAGIPSSPSIFTSAFPVEADVTQDGVSAAAFGQPYFTLVYEADVSEAKVEEKGKKRGRPPKHQDGKHSIATLDLVPKSSGNSTCSVDAGTKVGEKASVKKARNDKPGHCQL